MRIALLKALSVLVTTGALLTAATVGGVPVSPVTLAEATNQAAINAAIAADNLAEARRSTQALERITDNVHRQLDSSRRLLSTQLEIERSTRSGGSFAADIGSGVERIAGLLDELATRFRGLGRLALRAGTAADDTAAAAQDLSDALSDLEQIYEEVLEESRELNRKARGYAELRDGPW